MGYRGENVPSANGDRGRQQPWQPSSGSAPGSAGAWDDGSRGYSGDDDGGYGYGPDAGYPAQGQQGYGPQGGQYGDPYAREPYGGYGPGQGQGGYGGPQGYSGNDHGHDGPAGYEQPRGYDDRSAGSYGGNGGRPDQNAGYGRSGGYPTSPAAPRQGSGSYPAQGSGSYPAQGSGGYPTQGSSGSYPARHGSGGYPTQGSGPAPARQGSGAYPVADAGNDWYGGQPAAAKGASFADTGTYALNGRVIDEYGTGPQGTMRDPVRGYPPGPGQRGSGPMPAPPRLALPAPTATPPSVAETRQQERLDEPPGRPGRAPSGSFRGAATGGSPQAPSGGFRGAAGGDSRPAASGGFGGPGTGGFPGGAGRDAFGGPDDFDSYQDELHDFGGPSDPYQEDFDGAQRARPPRGSGRRPGKPGRGGSARGGKRPLLLAVLAVVVVGVVAAAAYVFVFAPHSSSGNAAATGPLPTGSAQPSMQACVKQFGIYCHIAAAADDPKPLTVAELYPPAVTDEKDKSSYSLVSTKLDTKCANAVIGQTLITALQTGKCSQVVRASYVSSDNKIMGTIGVINLGTTNEAHEAGRVVGQNDFIAPLTSAKGVASKLGNGEGVVEAEYKGHYLILTWSEYVDGTAPTTKAQDAQLEQFSNDLVNDTANVALTQRMVNGVPATAGATS